ncbi:MAG: N-acetylmuramoyl-L-alanine amidase, partial [Verrucomicrobiota bacterium]
AYAGHWYTSGNGHKFHVIHDMEGYYLSTISYFQRSSTQASIHYCVNGLKDTSTDSPAGEVSQMVREAYYAWHVLCWNTHCTGTEHEGFASNPAWYTEAMYQASADLTRHIADKFGYAKDRNHIIGHDQKRIAGWPAYASANLGIDPYCNTHTDPGLNWDWTHYMALINPTPVTITVDNSDPGFSVVGSSWSVNNYATDRLGADYRYHTTAAISEPATWTADLTAGTYKVYAWWPAGSNRSSSAPYIVYHTGGSTVVSVDQKVNGGKWNLLGTFTLADGANDVSLSCWTSPTGEFVMADGIRWIKQ